MAQTLQTLVLASSRFPGCQVGVTGKIRPVYRWGEEAARAATQMVQRAILDPPKALEARLEYTAPDFVHEIIRDLGQTEDVRFSPNNSRLAISSILKNQITIFEISTTNAPDGPRIVLSDAVRISSSHLRSPHGVDFIDDERIVVANRDGDVTTFALPCEGGGDWQLDPIASIPSGEFLKTPGAVSATRRDDNLYEVLVCNNFIDTVTRHVTDTNGGLQKSEVLLKKWLSFPDGITVNGNWIAISNHTSRNVFLYEWKTSLDDASSPDGSLGYIVRPHGVRFTSDGRFLLVADYQTPYLRIYERGEWGWHGLQGPTCSLRVMSNEEFLRGPAHGPGAKGVDIDSSSKTLVTTGEIQPLAFFDFAAIREQISSPQYDAKVERQIEYELGLQQPYLECLKTIELMTNSKSWKITAPLRRWNSFLQRIRLYRAGK